MLVPIVLTERLLLKSLDPDNLDPAYPQWLTDERVNRFLEIRFHPQTMDSVSGFVREMNASPDNYLFGIHLADSKQHIGNIKLGPVDRHHLHGAIGLLIGDPKQWGKGYAAEAIAGVTTFAFDTLALRKVYAGCYGANVGSRAAFIRAGWAEIARRPQHWRCEDRWTDDVILECTNPGARG